MRYKPIKVCIRRMFVTLKSQYVYFLMHARVGKRTYINLWIALITAAFATVLSYNPETQLDLPC
jgi:ribosomal protein L20